MLEVAFWHLFYDVAACDFARLPTVSGSGFIAQLRNLPSQRWPRPLLKAVTHKLASIEKNRGS